jgi:hypothetical protein
MSKDMSDSTTAFPTGSSDSYREFPDYDTVEERERALRWAINRAREVWTILRPSTGYRDDPNIGEIYGPEVYLYIENYEGGREYEIASLAQFTAPDSEIRAALVEAEEAARAAHEARMAAAQAQHDRAVWDNAVQALVRAGFSRDEAESVVNSKKETT